MIEGLSEEDNYCFVIEIILFANYSNADTTELFFFGRFAIKRLIEEDNFYCRLNNCFLSSYVNAYTAIYDSLNDR